MWPCPGTTTDIFPQNSLPYVPAFCFGWLLTSFDSVFCCTKSRFRLRWVEELLDSDQEVTGMGLCELEDYRLVASEASNLGPKGSNTGSFLLLVVWPGAPSSFLLLDVTSRGIFTTDNLPHLHADRATDRVLTADRSTSPADLQASQHRFDHRSKR